MHAVLLGLRPHSVRHLLHRPGTDRVRRMQSLPPALSCAVGPGVAPWKAVPSGERVEAALRAALHVGRAFADPVRVRRCVALTAADQTDFPRSVRWSPHDIAQGDAGLALAGVVLRPLLSRCRLGHDRSRVPRRCCSSLWSGTEVGPGACSPGPLGWEFVTSQLSRAGGRVRPVARDPDRQELDTEAERLKRTVEQRSGRRASRPRVRRDFRSRGGHCPAVAGADTEAAARTRRPRCTGRAGPWLRTRPAATALVHTSRAIPERGGTIAVPARRPELRPRPRDPRAAGGDGAGALGRRRRRRPATRRGAAARGSRTAATTSGAPTGRHGRAPRRRRWRERRAGRLVLRQSRRRAGPLARGRALGDDGPGGLPWRRWSGSTGAPSARQIDSPTFCHGVAGLLQITLRFRTTPGSRFRQAADELTDQLLEGYEPRRRCSASATSSRAANRVDHLGLLDGAPGVALVLLAAASRVEPTWDRLFLLA